MQIISDFLAGIKPLLPTGITLLIIIMVILGVRFIINKRAAGSGYHVRRQVLTMLLSFIGLLIIIMAIPDQYLSETSRGQLLSLIGILLSAAIALSSTTFIGNAMAGMMLRAVKSFRPGDFVRVGDHFGRVTERGLFHIEIQTEDRDLTTLPNLYLVTNPVKVIRSSGTIVSAEVSLGYDVPRRAVELLLKKAAEKAELQESFVLIMDLGDFSVTYRISGMLTEVKHIITARSRLRRMMLDELHQAGIEIVSPAFMNTRALPESKVLIPKEYKDEVSENIQAEPALESLAFDKAEEAASIEKLNEMLAATAKDIETLKELLKETLSESEKEKIKMQLEKIEARRERISEYINKINEQKENN